QLVDRGQMEQLLRTGIIAILNQSSNIGVTGRDDSVEWRVNALKLLQLFQSTHICFGGISRCSLRVKVADRLIRLLLRDDVGLQQKQPAVRGYLCQLEISLRCPKLALCLLQLLIKFGRFDLGQKLSLFRVCTDIQIPLLQIPTGTRIDRRLGERFGGARQCDFLRAGIGLGMHDFYQSRGAGSNVLLQSLFGFPSRPNPGVDESDKSRENNDRQYYPASRRSASPI